IIIYILLALVLIVGIDVGYLIRNSIAGASISSVENLTQQIVDKASSNTDHAKKEELLETKEESHAHHQESLDALRERRLEIQKQEDRIVQREEVLDKKSITFDKREVSLEKREESLAEKQQQIEEMESKVEATLAEQHTELERISGYTTDQAKQVI